MTAGGFITAIESASTARGDDDRQVISWTSDFNFEPNYCLSPFFFMVAHYQGHHN